MRGVLNVLIVIRKVEASMQKGIILADCFTREKVGKLAWLPASIAKSVQSLRFKLPLACVGSAVVGRLICEGWPRHVFLSLVVTNQAIC